MERVDLGSELRTAAKNSEGLDPSRPVTADGFDGVLVDVDPDRLQQVLSNLLDNSRKNAPAGEPIVIEARLLSESVPPRVRVSVVDSGPGVDAESAERIFDKFVRINDNAVTGTGLGLYIARRIIEAHDGRIWCESEAGAHRTAFTFELPAAAVSARTADPDPEIAAHAGGSVDDPVRLATSTAAFVHSPVEAPVEAPATARLIWQRASVRVLPGRSRRRKGTPR